MTKRYREEKDTLGTVRVPADALYGAQTARAVENFPISGRPLPALFIQSLATLKFCAAEANVEAGVLTRAQGRAIRRACKEVMSGRHLDQFPVDVFQTGSGTSTNMNMNEVIARLASRRLGQPVDPNDQVNASQSSNDTIPSAIHLSAMVALEADLVPALVLLEKRIRQKGKRLRRHVKTGRTHLMDALPLRFDQEFGAWAQQLRERRQGLAAVQRPLRRLVQGGSAIGTGVNVPPAFVPAFFEALNRVTGLKFKPAKNRLAGMGAQDTAVALSGALRGCAVTLMKIANDLRWMNSGPLCGLGEIALPALQPGSSIMPGKVNPVIPEAVCMVAAEVIGKDVAVAVAGQSGSFQLNVMLPLIADHLLGANPLLSEAARLTAERAIKGLTVNEQRLQAHLAVNPMLVTALNPVIGYKQSAAIAQQAYREERPILDVALERTTLSEAELRALLDPLQFT